jgi:hypothetical protein
MLTTEQQAFAAENHDLVYSFLHAKRLPEDEFYDVVIFGYLRAVQRYFTQPGLRRYAFSTIAWRAMNCEAGHHREREARIRTISLEAMACGHRYSAGPGAGLETDRVMDALENVFFWDAVSGSLSEEHADILRLTAEGYTPREIAESRQRPLRDTIELVASALESAKELCFA